MGGEKYLNPQANSSIYEKKLINGTNSISSLSNEMPKPTDCFRSRVSVHLCDLKFQSKTKRVIETCQSGAENPAILLRSLYASHLDSLMKQYFAKSNWKHTAFESHAMTRSENSIQFYLCRASNNVHRLQAAFHKREKSSCREL